VIDDPEELDGDQLLDHQMRVAFKFIFQVAFLALVLGLLIVLVGSRELFYHFWSRAVRPRTRLIPAELSCRKCGSFTTEAAVDSEQREVITRFGDLSAVSMSLPGLRFFGYAGPLLALAMCITMARVGPLWNKVVKTHCRNAQFWPSISALLGASRIFQMIWIIGIHLSSIQRFHDGILYNKFYRAWIDRPAFSMASRHHLHALRWLMVCCYYLEQIALFGISWISSRDYYRLHQHAFILFASSSHLFMIAMVLLDYLLNRHRAALLASTPKELLAACRARWTHFDRFFRIKLLLLILSFSGYALAGLLYRRHRLFCEPYVYSYFALTEFIVVFINIAFHCVIAFEFPDLNTYVIGTKLPKSRSATALPISLKSM
jgi:hypothetical protein